MEKPPTFAVALKYEKDKQDAPVVTAKGARLIADQILKVAGENDIPLYHDAELVNLLSQVPIGDEIPQELYLAVAEVLAFTYALNGKSLTE
jgi:flagellar biosynthesis protein